MSWSNFNAGSRCKDCFSLHFWGNFTKFKDYILPSNKIVKIQGYENYALDILLNIYNEIKYTLI